MANKELQSLSGWNRERDGVDRNTKAIPNGIACPKCGKELCDRDQSNLLLSDPPKLEVDCPGCHYSGYRIR